MRYCKTLVVMLMLLPVYLFAQQNLTKQNTITGLWTGTLSSDSSQQNYKYEIAISEKDGKYNGYSHTWFIIEGKEYFAIKKVSIKMAKDGKVIVLDEALISHNLPELPVKYSKQLNVLDLNSSNTKTSLEGIFVTNRTKQYQSLTGSVKLKYSENFSQSALLPSLKKLNINNDLTQNEMAYIPASNSTIETK